MDEIGMMLPVMTSPPHTLPEQLTELGRRVRALRKRRKMTQAQLAERLGIEVRHLQFIEAAESAPGFDLLVDLAAELEVAVGDLFEEAETPARRRGRPPKA